MRIIDQPLPFRVYDDCECTLDSSYTIQERIDDIQEELDSLEREMITALPGDLEDMTEIYTFLIRHLMRLNEKL